MELYFEDDLLGNSCESSYYIGDVVSFIKEDNTYVGIIENISPGYHHNISYIFYTIKEVESGVKILIEEDIIIKNYYPEILLIEIEYELDSNIEYLTLEEYKDFSFVIW